MSATTAATQKPTATKTEAPENRVLLTLEVSMQELGPQMAATKFEPGKPPQTYLYRGSNKAATLDGMIAEITPLLRSAKWTEKTP